MISSGYGEDNYNEIVAFDKALAKAGVQNCNLVAVSSMLSEGARMIPFDTQLLKTGEVIFCVLSRNNSGRGKSAFSGLGVALGSDKSNPTKKYGFVLEAHGNTYNKVNKLLTDGLKEMARIRNFKVDDYKIYIEGSKRIKLKYGCAITILVYR